MPSKRKPIKITHKKRPPVVKRRKLLEKQIEDILKFIIAWRDSQQCVMREMDGGRCGDGLMWNHLIAQGQSGWLKLSLSNTFWGCGNHNLLDFHGDKTLTLWYVKMFGVDALDALQTEARLRVGQKRTEAELEELLLDYTDLYQERFYVDAELEALVEHGYYGTTIQDVWRKQK